MYHALIFQDTSGASLSPPDLRQDPLLRQLRDKPERFKEDFLELPLKKQAILLKVLRSNGVSRFDVNKLTPPDYKQNPLLRILNHNSIDSLEKNILSPPPLIQDVMDNPEDFSDDFKELQNGSKVKLLKMIEVFDAGDFKIEKLTLNKLERLQIVPHHSKDPLNQNIASSPAPDSFADLLDTSNTAGNPLLHFIEASEDKEGRHSRYEKDPLLRQLRLNPESYQDDFLELPRRKQDTLLKLLRGDEGLEARLVERLVPPGQRQDPLLRALIAGYNSSVEGLQAPRSHGNPLLRLLHPDGRDNRDKGNLSPPKYRQNPLLRQLRLYPKKYRDDFLNLPEEDQKELVEIIKNEKGAEQIMREMVPQQFGRLLVTPLHPRDPLAKPLPEDAQSDAFSGDFPASLQTQLFRANKDGEEKEALLPPRYKQNPLLRQLLTEPKVYKDAFLELPRTEQDTLLKILKKEGGESFDISLLAPPESEEEREQKEEEKGDPKTPLGNEGNTTTKTNANNTNITSIIPMQLYSFSAFTIGQNLF